MIPGLMRKKAMSLDEALKEGTEILLEANVPNARNDAEMLLYHVAKINRAYRLAHGDEEVNITCEDDKLKRYFELINRRAERIPLQHILGYQDFMGLRFYVNRDVLIPRFDTEILVEEAMKRINDGMTILDMCTGSGCILTSLIYYSNGCSGVYADISDLALKVAKKNAEVLLKDKIEQSDIKLYYVNSDIFDSFTTLKNSGNSEIPLLYDIIVSNPPYIETEVIDSLEEEVKGHDPIIALDGGADGLKFYREIIDKAQDFLTKSGTLIFEIGYNQGKAVSDYMKEKGYVNVEVIQDLNGLDRVVVGNKSCLTN